MSFSSGTFSINTTGQPVVTGTVISSTAFNALTADLATGLSTCVLKDGTQTMTGNIPMSGFKLTGLGAGSAAGESLRYEQGVQSILTTIGDTIQTTAANTPARLPAVASVAAHATTSNIWGAREITLSGAAVTFTDIADAPYVGAVSWVKQQAANVWTNGAVFSVQGAVNYTAAAGDWIRVYATTVSTFEITVFRVGGFTPITASLSGNVDLNNAANYFDGPSIAQGTVGTWLVSGTVTLGDTAGAADFYVKLWDGTTVIDSSAATCRAAGGVTTNLVSVTLSGYINAPAGNLRMSARDTTSTSGKILFDGTGNAKDSTITAIRIA